MIDYIQINILDMLEYIGEDSCKNILYWFKCPINFDVEDFLHQHDFFHLMNVFVIIMMLMIMNKYLFKCLNILIIKT